MEKGHKFLYYNNEIENVSVEVLVKDESIWLTQKSMAALFGIVIPEVYQHVNNIYAEDELEESTTVSAVEIVRQEGVHEVKRAIKFYNLDVIFTVGYRVNPRKASNFRIWATSELIGGSK